METENRTNVNLDSNGQGSTACNTMEIDLATNIAQLNKNVIKLGLAHNMLDDKASLVSVNALTDTNIKSLDLRNNYMQFMDDLK